jgi:hypothetical protein
MTTQLQSESPTPFQQILAPFCQFIAKIWFSLFFVAPASKFNQILITTNRRVSNQIQREFLFNNAIASQNFFSYSARLTISSNLLKPLLVRFPFNLVLRQIPNDTLKLICQHRRTNGVSLWNTDL